MVAILGSIRSGLRVICRKGPARGSHGLGIEDVGVFETEEPAFIPAPHVNLNLNRSNERCLLIEINGALTRERDRRAMKCAAIEDI